MKHVNIVRVVYDVAHVCTILISPGSLKLVSEHYSNCIIEGTISTKCVCVCVLVYWCCTCNNFNIVTSVHGICRRM